MPISLGNGKETSIKKESYDRFWGPRSLMEYPASQKEKWMYTVLCAHSDKNGVCRITDKRLMKYNRISRTTVWRQIKSLIKMGLIEIRNGVIFIHGEADLKAKIYGKGNKNPIVDVSKSNVSKWTKAVSKSSKGDVSVLQPNIRDEDSTFSKCRVKSLCEAKPLPDPSPLRGAGPNIAAAPLAEYTETESPKKSETKLSNKQLEDAVSTLEGLTKLMMNQSARSELRQNYYSAQYDPDEARNWLKENKAYGTVTMLDECSEMLGELGKRGELTIKTSDRLSKMRAILISRENAILARRAIRMLRSSLCRDLYNTSDHIFEAAISEAATRTASESEKPVAGIYTTLQTEVAASPPKQPVEDPLDEEDEFDGLDDDEDWDEEEDDGDEEG